MFTVLVILLPVVLSAPIEILAPQNLPDGCKLELITVQEQVEEKQVEKVVCETEFRPSCNIRVEKECKNVTRPACVVEERMECEEAKVNKCEIETRLVPGGEKEEVEVCRDIPIEDCRLVQEEKCEEGVEDVEVEECEEKEVEDCEIIPHEECHQVIVDLPRIQDKQVQQIVCEQDQQENEVEQNDFESDMDENEIVKDDTEIEDTYDILDVVHSIFGGPKVEESEGDMVEDVFEETTDNNSETTTTSVEEDSTTTEGTTTMTTITTTTSEPTTMVDESSSVDATTTEMTTLPTTVSSTSSSVTSTSTESSSDNSRIFFSHGHDEDRDFSTRIGHDPSIAEARRKEIEARRQAASSASRIYFPEVEDENEFSIPS